MSSLAYANTLEMATKFECKPTTVEIAKNTFNEDDWWFCYKIGEVETEDFMTDDHIVTVIYKCIWVKL